VSHGSKLEERAVPTAMGKPEAGQESDSSASEDARSELERLRKEIGEKRRGIGEEVEPIPMNEYAQDFSGFSGCAGCGAFATILV